MSTKDSEKEKFQEVTGVSRETLGRLGVYADLLTRWQSAINLIGPSTIDHIWTRHFLDSAQLARYIDMGSSIADIGSGAGFPGLVLAIMGVGQVDLIERDSRKGVFLTEAVRQTAAPARVHQIDARQLCLEHIDVVTARAFAPLDEILKISEPFINKTTYCVFHKGKTYEEELTAARKNWNMDVEAFESRTDSSGIILRIRNIVYSNPAKHRI
jgi:16S rRNA (guanine527-N7)-methyltransferase